MSRSDWKGAGGRGGKVLQTMWDLAGLAKILDFILSGF